MTRSPLPSLFLVVFIDLLGFGLIVPILPYYAQSLGASGMELGLLMMCYSGMQFFFSPVWGRLSDRLGRKKILMICLGGIGCSMLILAGARSLTWLFIGRLLAGMFGANISVANAYVADVTSPENRAKGMGVIGAAFGLGFVMGPPLGGLLASPAVAELVNKGLSALGLPSINPYGLPALGALLLVVVNLAFAVHQLVEPALSETERLSHRNRLKRSLVKEVMGNPRTAYPVILFFLATSGMAEIETTFALFLKGRFGWDALQAGLLLALMGLVMAGLQGGGIGKLAKRFGETKLLLAGLVLVTLALAGVILSLNPGLLVASLILHGLGYGLINPSLLSLTSRSAKEGLQGGTMGVYQSAGSLARIVGPLIAGALIDIAGLTAPFVVAALFFALAGLLLFSKQKLWPVLIPHRRSNPSS